MLCAMRIFLVALLAMSCTTEPETAEKWPLYRGLPPALEIPRYDENGCMTAEQIRTLVFQIEEARTWEKWAVGTIEQCYGPDAFQAR